MYSCAITTELRRSSSAAPTVRSALQMGLVGCRVFTSVLSGVGEVDVDGHVATVPLNVKCCLGGIFHHLVKLDGITRITERQTVHRGDDISRLESKGVKSLPDLCPGAIR